MLIFSDIISSSSRESKDKLFQSNVIANQGAGTNPAAIKNRILINARMVIGATPIMLEPRIVDIVGDKATDSLVSSLKALVCTLHPLYVCN